MTYINIYILPIYIVTFFEYMFLIRCLFQISDVSSLSELQTLLVSDTIEYERERGRRGEQRCLDTKYVFN